MLIVFILGFLVTLTAVAQTGERQKFYAALTASKSEKREANRDQGKMVSVKQALNEVEIKYKIVFGYESGLLENLAVPSEQWARVTSLTTAMETLLKPYNLTYGKVEKGVYFIKKKTSKKEKEETNQIEMSKPSDRDQLNMISPADNSAMKNEVKGRVIDANGEPLPGLNIIIKGSASGTSTNVDGVYFIEVPSRESVLIFSFVGFLTQEITVGEKTVIDVKLLTDTKLLSEVVVTALGVKREERSLGYSVQGIKPEGMDEARETNIVNSLTGKIAGVQITNSSGNIGGSSRITIRGINSISGNNQPLFVVDGTPIDNSNYNTEQQNTGNPGRDYGNAAQDINPDDIASISILKGPSAAALYGSRAGNGVILITTKSGETGKGIGVTFNSTTSFSRAAILPDFQNEYGGGFKLTFDNYKGVPIVNTNANNSWGPKFEGQLVRHWWSMYPGEPGFEKTAPWVAAPNNLKDFLDTGVNLGNNVAIAGSTEKSTFRLSYTNLYQTGIIPNSKLKRHTFSLSADTKLTSKLTATVKANYIKTIGFGRPATGEWLAGSPNNVLTYWYTWSQRQMDPATLKVYKSERYRHMTWNVRGPETYMVQSFNNNPYFTLYEEYNNDSRDRLYGNVSLSYNLSKDLKLTGWARTDLYTDRREDRSGLGGYEPNRYEEDVIQFQENNFEFLAQYSKQLGSDFNINANLGTNLRRSKFSRNFGRTVGGLSVPNFFNLSASVDRPIISDVTRERSATGIYGSFNMGFRNIVYVDGSLRNDWSSTLPVNNNSYLYPALSTSIVFTDLLPASTVLSFGKLRAGWAQVGNDTDPYRTSLIYESQIAYGSSPAYSVPNTLNNQLLKPERTSSYEIGLDLRFFNKRAGLDVTFYNNVTTDQIIPLSISPTTSYKAAVVNAGKLNNKGIELMLTGTPVSIENGFEWNVALNWAKNKNKVIELAEGQDTYEIGFRDGVSVVAKVGQPYGTLIGTGIKRNEKGEKMIDQTGFYIREPGHVMGSVLASFTGGLTNTFSYKGFNLSTLIDFQKGGDIFTETIRNGVTNGQFKETVGLNDRGEPKRNLVANGGGVRGEGVLADGSENTKYVEAQNYFKQFGSIQEPYVFDASYIKFRELRLGYAFPKRLYQKSPFTSVSFSLVARNVALLFRNMPHLDPSELAYGSGNIQGLEGAAIPAPRTMGFNIKFGL